MFLSGKYDIAIRPACTLSHIMSNNTKILITHNLTFAVLYCDMLMYYIIFNPVYDVSHILQF